MQIKHFQNGFAKVVHKIPSHTGKGRYSAWFDHNGKLLDAEFIDYLTNRSHEVSQPSIIEYLQQIGRRIDAGEIKDIMSGAL